MQTIIEMEDLGFYAQKKFAIATGMALEDLTGRLAAQTEKYTLCDAPTQDGQRYFLSINYKDIGGWVNVEVWIEQTGKGYAFSISMRQKDGRSERHTLNSVAKLLEGICTKET